MSTITDKQLLLLYVVGEGTGNVANYWLDIDQIIEKLASLGWEVSKPSLQFAIRYLLKDSLIEKRSNRKRRSAWRRPLATTNAGRAVLREMIASGRLAHVLAQFRSTLCQRSSIPSVATAAFVPASATTSV